MRFKFKTDTLSRIAAVVSVIAVLCSSLFIESIAVSGAGKTKVWDGSSDTEFEGAGTKDNPYKITSAAELYGFATARVNVKDSEQKYYVLTNDIYLNDVSSSDWMNNSPREWAKMGADAANDASLGFSGFFDGQGHTVYGMYYDNYTAGGTYGLIPMVTGNAEITNVNLRHSFAAANNSVEFHMGGIVGFVQKNNGDYSPGYQANVKISKCVVDNTVDFSRISGSLLGGIIGPVRESKVTVSYCGSAAKFSDYGNPSAGKGGGIICAPGHWGAEYVRIINSYSVVAFVSGWMGGIKPADISDGTLYSTQSWWATDGGVNLTPVASEASMQGKGAENNMPKLGWDVWQANEGAYPTIKGSTAYENGSGSDLEIWDGSSDTKFEGDGTKENPYKISSAEQLYGFSSNTSFTKENSENLYFVLTKDIFLNNIKDKNWLNNNPKEWASHGDTTWMYQGFAGHFDGQGHTVYGMYYRTYKEKYAYGLIPRANGNAVISNVNVRYAYAAPNNNVDVYMGGILGCVDLAPGNKASVITVSKCVVDNTVNFSDLANCHVGGIIGCGHYAKITVEYCGSAAKFNDYGNPAGSGWGGGIVASNVLATSYLRIVNSYSVVAFITGNLAPYLKDASAISDGTLYSAHSWWISQGVNLTAVSGESAMQSDAAKVNMPNLGWDVWEINKSGYPIIKGSTAGKNVSDAPVGDYYDGKKGEVWSGKTAAGYKSGSGEKDDPYIIETAEQLYKMVKEHCLSTDPEPGAYYELAADIYLNDVKAENWYTAAKLNSWYSINLTEPNTGFKGRLNGRGYTVYGLYCNNISEKCGLIPVLAGRGNVVGVNIRKAYLSGRREGNCYLGGIAGYIQTGSNVRISKCSVRDSIFGAAAAVGGLIGGVSAGSVDVTSCYFVGSFENKSNYAGGFYGDSWGTANVTDSYTVGCVAIDKSFGMPSGIRYSTVSQSQARHGDAQNIAVNVVKEEQIIGESARNAMPELKWDTIWNTVENDFPHMDQKSSDSSTDGVPGQIWSGLKAEDYAGGTGTEEDPYQIATGEQLYKMVSEHTVYNDTPAYYVLTEDIKLNDTSSENWYDGKKLNHWYVTFGISNAFAGHLDGQGHIVSGIYIRTEADNVRGALIPGIDTKASIKNVGILDSYIDVSTVKNEAYGAAFAAYVKNWREEYEVKEENYPVISGCFADTSVIVRGNFAGGMVSGTPSPIKIEDSYFVGKLIGGSRCGALLGNAFAPDSIIRNCYACTADFDQIVDGRGDLIAAGNTYENVYTFGVAVGLGVTFVNADNMCGVNAKSGMPGLDYDKVWMTVDDTMPILRIFYPRIKRSATATARKTRIDFVTNAEGVTVPPIEGLIGAKLVLPNPVREGYRFEGWYVYSELQCKFTETIFPAGKLTLYAKWELTSVVQDFENYPATEYDLGEDHEYYRPGVAGYVADKVHGGSKAIHRKGLASVSDEFLVNYDDELTVGAEYKLKFWIMTDTAGASGNISLAFKTWPDVLEKNNGVEKMLSVSSLKQNEWTEVTYSFTARTPWLAFVSDGNTSIFFDDVMIVRTSDTIHSIKNLADDKLPESPNGNKNNNQNTDTKDNNTSSDDNTSEEIKPTEDNVEKPDNGKKTPAKSDDTQEEASNNYIWIIIGAVIAAGVLAAVIIIIAVRKKKSIKK